jgi:hypothetical protein
MAVPESKLTVVLRLSIPLLLVLSIFELHLYRMPLAGLAKEHERSALFLRMAYPWGVLVNSLTAAIIAATLILMAVNDASRQSVPGRFNYRPIIFVLALLTASIYRIASGGDVSALVLQSTSIILAGYMVYRFMLGGAKWIEKIVVVLLAAYQFIPRLVLAVDAVQAGGDFSASLYAVPLAMAEYIMLAAIFMFVPCYMGRFLSLNRTGKLRAVIMATAIAAMLFWFYLVEPLNIAGILSRTSGGLQLLLPTPFYILAIWSVMFTAVTLRAAGNRSHFKGFALVFIFLSGFIMINPYQHLLSALGFTILGTLYGSDG